MNRIFNWIEKYKDYGLIATVAAYMFIFSYLQMTSYKKLYPISPFIEGPEIVTEQEEIPLEPDQIEVPPNYMGDVKNITRDRNDKREKSDKNWSQNTMDGAAYAKALEQSYKDETGGEAKRAKFARNTRNLKNKKNYEKKKWKRRRLAAQNNSGGDKQYSGNVLVEADVPNRNSNRLPIPGYMCGRGASGTIVIDVEVNQSGNVTSAKFNAGASSSSNHCMVENATKYALNSRFNYSSSAPKSQSGKIYYTFISQ